MIDRIGVEKVAFIAIGLMLCANGCTRSDREVPRDQSRAGQPVIEDQHGPVADNPDGDRDGQNTDTHPDAGGVVNSAAAELPRGRSVVRYRKDFQVASEVEPWREELYQNWKKLPEPPVTPYDGPFGGDARAFVGEVDWKHPNQAAVANWKAMTDYRRTAENGIYDPRKDPRPIDAELEAAILEDWRRMGYNCAYKGKSFTFMVGSFLKEQGMLGAIDQTLWGNNGPPPLQFDGTTEGRRHREACGSFFHPHSYRTGVDAIFGMGYHYGHHLFTVGDHRLTCSWDEVGLRTRRQMDYRGEMKQEFRKFLKEVWFRDDRPDRDTNRDGRTYNRFTGERLGRWEQVEPFPVSLDWTQPAWSDGERVFSKMPEVDRKLFQQPARYKLLVDFHRYFTFEFFRRINEEATRRINVQGKPGRITCYPFVQHFIIWPGANQTHGNSFYWYHRLSPVVNVEHMWPDAPVMNLNYAITDRLAPQFKNTVMGWVWLYFGHQGADMYDGPHDIERAMARMMGHTVDGTHHWLYSPHYRGRDRKQRRQIAYWQNFFKAHYEHYLADSATPHPQIALLMPDYTGYFYRYFQYPKQDFAWMGEAFQNLQYQYDILTEEELELNPRTLDGYKVLYVVGSEWTTPTIRRRVVDFLDRGGVIYTNVDSLSLDMTTGRRSDFLVDTFAAKLVCKHKNAFYPSTQTADEAVWALQFDTWGGPLKLQGNLVHRLEDPRAWAKLYARTPEQFTLDADGQPARDEMNRKIRHPSWKMIRDEHGNLVRDEALWRQLDAQMAEMPQSVRGLEQRPLDMRTPPQVTYRNGTQAPNWSEIVEAEPVNGGKPIARWDGKVVGIETENTVWMGTREGMNLHAISPRISAHRATEPCNPFPSKIPERYESHRPYAEAVGYAARKAGVRRVVAARLEDRLPMNLEVLPRVDDRGTLMVIVINHDRTDATYNVSVDPAYVHQNAEAWDLLAEKTIETNTDGKFRRAVAPWGVSVFMLGNPEDLAPIKTAQAKLNRMDMGVPRYFLDRDAN